MQHGMANDGARMFLFGGEDEAHEKFSDLYELDARESSAWGGFALRISPFVFCSGLLNWLEIFPDGYTPSARCGHTGAAVGPCLYVVGGAGGGVALADVNYLDTRQFFDRAFNLQTANSQPVPLQAPISGIRARLFPRVMTACLSCCSRIAWLPSKASCFYLEEERRTPRAREKRAVSFDRSTQVAKDLTAAASHKAYCILRARMNHFSVLCACRHE